VVGFGGDGNGNQRIGGGKNENLCGFAIRAAVGGNKRLAFDLAFLGLEGRSEGLWIVFWDGGEIYGRGQMGEESGNQEGCEGFHGEGKSKYRYA
jgi:hypothetical protein